MRPDWLSFIEKWPDYFSRLMNDMNHEIKVTYVVFTMKNQAKFYYPKTKRTQSLSIKEQKMMIERNTFAYQQ